MKKKIIGIDPGLNGAVALLTKQGLGKIKVEEVWEAPYDLRSILKKYKPKMVVVEKQQAMNNQGVVSTFTTGRNFGFIEGILCAYSTPYYLISPQTWMKVVGSKYQDIKLLDDLTDSKLKETKKLNLSICASLFDIELRTKRGRWKDGIADAILIALYEFIKEDN